MLQSVPVLSSFLLLNNIPLRGTVVLTVIFESLDINILLILAFHFSAPFIPCFLNSRQPIPFPELAWNTLPALDSLFSPSQFSICKQANLSNILQVLLLALLSFESWSSASPLPQFTCSV